MPSQIVFESQAELEAYVDSVIRGTAKPVEPRRKQLDFSIPRDDIQLSRCEHAKRLSQAHARRSETLSHSVKLGCKRARALAQSLRERRRDHLGHGVVPMSPGEEERLKREELSRRRRERLLQVREQEKLRAAETRAAYRRRRRELEDCAADDAEARWKEDHNKELCGLHEQYRAALASIGNAHRAAMAASEARAARTHDEIEERRKQRTAERTRHDAALAKARHERRSHPVVKQRNDGLRREEVRRTMSQSQRVQAKKYAKRRSQNADAEAAAIAAAIKEAKQGVDVVFETNDVVNCSGFRVQDYESTRFHAHVVQHALPTQTPAEPTAFEKASALRIEKEALEKEKEKKQVIAEKRAAERGAVAMERVRMVNERKALTATLEGLAQAERRAKLKAAAVSARDVARSSTARMAEREKRLELEHEFERIFVGSTVPQPKGVRKHSRQQKQHEGEPSGRATEYNELTTMNAATLSSEAAQAAAQVDATLGRRPQHWQPSDAAVAAVLRSGEGVSSAANFLDNETRALLAQSVAARESAARRMREIFGEAGGASGSLAEARAEAAEIAARATADAEESRRSFLNQVIQYEKARAAKEAALRENARHTIAGLEIDAARADAAADTATVQLATRQQKQLQNSKSIALAPPDQPQYSTDATPTRPKGPSRSGPSPMPSHLRDPSSPPTRAPGSSESRSPVLDQSPGGHIGYSQAGRMPFPLRAAQASPSPQKYETVGLQRYEGSSPLRPQSLSSQLNSSLTKYLEASDEEDSAETTTAREAMFLDSAQQEQLTSKAASSEFQSHIHLSRTGSVDISIAADEARTPMHSDVHSADGAYHTDGSHYTDFINNGALSARTAPKQEMEYAKPSSAAQRSAVSSSGSSLTQYSLSPSESESSGPSAVFQATRSTSLAAALQSSLFENPTQSSFPTSSSIIAEAEDAAAKAFDAQRLACEREDEAARTWSEKLAAARATLSLPVEEDQNFSVPRSQRPLSPASSPLITSPGPRVTNSAHASIASSLSSSPSHLSQWKTSPANTTEEPPVTIEMVASDSIARELFVDDDSWKTDESFLALARRVDEHLSKEEKERADRAADREAAQKFQVAQQNLQSKSSTSGDNKHSDGTNAAMMSTLGESSTSGRDAVSLSSSYSSSQNQISYDDLEQRLRAALASIKSPAKAIETKEHITSMDDIGYTKAESEAASSSAESRAGTGSSQSVDSILLYEVGTEGLHNRHKVRTKATDNYIASSTDRIPDALFAPTSDHGESVVSASSASVVSVYQHSNTDQSARSIKVEGTVVPASDDSISDESKLLIKINDAGQQRSDRGVSDDGAESIERILRHVNTEGPVGTSSEAGTSPKSKTLHSDRTNESAKEISHENVTSSEHINTEVIETTSSALTFVKSETFRIEQTVEDTEETSGEAITSIEHIMQQRMLQQVVADVDSTMMKTTNTSTIDHSTTPTTVETSDLGDNLTSDSVLFYEVGIGSEDRKSLSSVSKEDSATSDNSLSGSGLGDQARMSTALQLHAEPPTIPSQKEEDASYALAALDAATAVLEATTAASTVSGSASYQSSDLALSSTIEYFNHIAVLEAAADSAVLKDTVSNAAAAASTASVTTVDEALDAHTISAASKGASIDESINASLEEVQKTLADAKADLLSATSIRDGESVKYKSTTIVPESLNVSSVSTASGANPSAIDSGTGAVLDFEQEDGEITPLRALLAASNSECSTGASSTADNSRDLFDSVSSRSQSISDELTAMLSTTSEAAARSTSEERVMLHSPKEHLKPTEESTGAGVPIVIEIPVHSTKAERKRKMLAAKSKARADEAARRATTRPETSRVVSSSQTRTTSVRSKIGRADSKRRQRGAATTSISSTQSSRTWTRQGKGTTAMFSPSAAGGESEAKPKLPPPELLSRLASGKRAPVKGGEAKHRTNRLYKKLPEVEKRKKAAEDKIKAHERRQRVREAEEERRRRLLASSGASARRKSRSSNFGNKSRGLL